jgi:hypothetical protein
MPVVWNSVSSTDARKLERIQRKFAALCQNSFLMLVFFNKASYFILQGGSNMTGTNCDLFTHQSSRSYLNHLVFSSVYSGLKCCPSLLDATGIRVPLCNIACVGAGMA